MKHLTILGIIVFVIQLGTVEASEPKTISELFKKIEHFAGAKPKSDVGRAYIDELKLKEGDTIPYLIEALSHPDIGVAAMAAAAMGEFKEIDVKYFDEIVIGLDRGIDWLPRALAKIKDDMAAEEAVKRYLISSSSPHNQESYALNVHDIRAVPFIVEAAVSNNGNDPRTYYLLGTALKEMSEEARRCAAESIEPILRNNAKNDSLLKGLLKMVSFLGEDGLTLEDAIVSLEQKTPLMQECVNESLLGIKSRRSGKILRSELQQMLQFLEAAHPEVDDNPFEGIWGARMEVIRLLNDIGYVGISAYDAGDEIAKLLDNEDWEIRRAAASTIGLIGWTDAVPQLINLLNDESDVVINRIAAFSLGRLKDHSARQPLHEVARGHWHPTVRLAAEKALKLLDHTGSLTAKETFEMLGLGFGGYTNFGLDDGSSDINSAPEVSTEEKLYRSSSPEEIEQLSYKSERIGFTANDEAEQREKKGDGAVIEVNEGNIMAVRTEIDVVPDVALRVSNGWIVGNDRGEWGGELMYLDSEGNNYMILNENVQDVHRLGTKLIVIAGLAHLFTNNGIIWILSQDGESIWQAKPWRALPGAPMWSRKTESGEVLISTLGGGDVLLSEEGHFTMAENEQVSKDTLEN